MRYVDLGKTVENHQNKRMKEDAKNKRKFGGVHIFLLLGVVLLGFGLLFSKSVRALFNPVSIVSNIVSPNLKETDGRTNILLLGLDRRATPIDQSILTDTLLFASIGRVEKNVAMVSLPRDLWVKADAGKGSHFMKINAVYAVDGVDELVRVAEEVLGMPVHYYAVVDFNLFKDSINILGGVEVDVENSFVDFEYPIEGREADLCGRTSEEIGKMEGYVSSAIFPCRYETVSFEKGKQIMDGETALKYVRSRKGSNGEGTDFARSHRQQTVIMAIKNKMLSLETLIDLPKLAELYTTYADHVDTNIGVSEVQGFYLLSQQIDFSSVRSIVLDDRSAADQGGLLYEPTDASLYGGAYVLVPRAENYSQLHAYIQRYVFGE